MLQRIQIGKKAMITFIPIHQRKPVGFYMGHDSSIIRSLIKNSQVKEPFKTLKISKCIYNTTLKIKDQLFWKSISQLNFN